MEVTEVGRGRLSLEAFEEDLRRVWCRFGVLEPLPVDMWWDFTRVRRFEGITTGLEWVVEGIEVGKSWADWPQRLLPW